MIGGTQRERRRPQQQPQGAEGSESGRAFRYAIATGRAERDPCPDLKGAIPPPEAEHLIPLASQVVAILPELHASTGKQRYVFPGRDPQKATSAAAINAALRRMGCDTKTEITGHGCRAMLRTIPHEELHIKPEVIEHQLAHSVPDALGTAYKRTRFLKARQTMMQKWADYLETVKAGAKVIPLNRQAA